MENTISLIILSIVSDEELLITILADAVVLCAAIIGVIINVLKVFTAKKERNKLIRIALVLVCIIVILFITPEIRKNYNIYHNYKFTEGEIIGFCKTSKNEDGVLFKYNLDGNVYQNCNNYFPFPKDSIKMNKKYKVRVNLNEPNDGRIILE
ncbi:MAG TPA: hypothetical protein PK995_06080 [Bacteroidia bacterium]|nr:hypothetical protein [Bacteroidia bacterium]